MYAMFAFLPEFVQTPPSAGYGFGASITQSGLMLLPSAVTMFVVGLFAGPARPGGSAARRWSSRGCLVGVRVDGDARLRARAAVGDLRRHRASWASASGWPSRRCRRLIVAAVPAEQTGVASGMNANIRTIGGSIGAAVMASIVTAKLEPPALPDASPATRPGSAIMAGVLVVAALAALLIPSQRRPTARRTSRRRPSVRWRCPGTR